jgi:AAA family ATP:ADP antiporter
MSNLIDFQFNALSLELHPGVEDRTEFISRFFLYMNSCSFLMMLFLSSLLFKYFDLRVGLLVLPVTNAFTSVMSMLGVQKGLMVSKFMDRSLNYSIQRASKEILYVPIPSEQKFQVKPILDAFAYRGSEALAAILVLPLLHMTQWKTLSFLVFVCSVTQFVLVFVTYREFKKLKTKKPEDLV